MREIMDIDFGTIAGLSLFRGVLGLAIGIALGNAWRDLRVQKFLSSIAGLFQAAVFVGLVALMQSEIRQYDDWPLIYWGIFVLTVLAGMVKTDSVLKSISLGAYIIFGGAFFFMGGWVLMSAIRSGFNVAGLIAGTVFMGVGASVLGALLYPYLKDKSITDD